ncbi:Sporulation-killing factor biosynthesis protein SkfC [compost metagenome]
MVYPWLFPLVAWTAGIGEEAVYRLFGIPMLKKIFRSTWIASLISSLIWAFGHTLYPIYPVISRPIELAFIGLIFSFIFLRSGFITVLFAHVIFDSVLMGLSLMIMGDIGNILTGIVYILLPAIVGSLIYVFKRRKPEAPAIVLED